MTRERKRRLDDRLGMLLSKRSVFGLVTLTSFIAGCGSSAAGGASLASGGSSAAGGAASSASGGSSSQAAPTFGVPAPYGGASLMQHVVAADFDGDGHPDVAVSGLAGTVMIRRNEGAGTLGESSVKGDPNDDVHDVVMVAGDINGDGRADLVFSATAYGYVADKRPTALVIHGQANGQVEDPQVLAKLDASNSLRAIFLADVDGDGHPDLVECKDKEIGVHSLGAQGDELAQAYVHEDTQQLCAAGDVNGDGRADLIARSGRSAMGVSLAGAGGALPELATLYEDTTTGFGMWAVDINGDGRADFVSAGYQTLTVRLAAADGTLGEPIITARPGDMTSGSDLYAHAAFADLNNDGKLDLALVGDGTNNSVAFFLGDGAGGFAPVSVDLALLGDGPPKDLAAADFDGDGLIDLAVLYGDRLYVILNTTGR